MEEEICTGSARRTEAMSICHDRADEFMLLMGVFLSVNIMRFVEVSYRNCWKHDVEA
jgi:4-hydroxy-3-methylbut-2-enyl diphosphate reductase IspH